MVRLTTTKRMELGKRFSGVDKSGDKKLDFNEMKQLLLQGNPNLEDAALKKLFKSIDKDDSGTVDFDEFVAYLYNAPPSYQNAPQACIDKFTEFAGPEMDGTEFSKFCVDCGLIDKGFRKEDIATIFAKVVPRGKRKITLEVGKDGFSQFDKLLSLLAEKKKSEVGELFQLVASGQKSSSGTKADAVKFHDDKSLYTGAHSANAKHGDTSKEAKVREKYDIGEETDWINCEGCFKAFDQGADGVSNREFAKLCDDAGICSKSFTMGQADLVFTKLRRKKLDFEGFKDALRLVAETKKEPIRDIQNAVSRCSGPSVKATVADSVRFHDDKDCYTGVHAGK